MDTSTNTQTNPKQKLFTELLRPKTLDQAIVVPRIREELSKGLVDNILFYGSPGTGKCLGYDEDIVIYATEQIITGFCQKLGVERTQILYVMNKKDDFSGSEALELITRGVKSLVPGYPQYAMAQMHIKIGDLFKLLNMDNDKYEATQKTDKDIYVADVDYPLVLNKIQAYVKKRVNLVKATIYMPAYGQETYLVAADHHIVLDEFGHDVRLDEAKTIKNVILGPGIIKNIEQLGEGDAYDIALKSPHYYCTSNGFIHHNTTLSRIMASYASEPLFINASMERGIDTIREKVISYATSTSLFGTQDKLRAVVLEECDNLTPDAWSSLRATIEQFHSDVRFIANCNYIDKVPEPIQSRFNCISIEPVNAEEDAYLRQGYAERVKQILTALKISYQENDIKMFIDTNYPDMRTIIKKIQQLYTRGVTVLSAENLGMTYDCSDIFQVILQPSEPWANYQALCSKWSNNAENAAIMIGKNFPQYVKTVMPEKINKLPVVLITIGDYLAQMPRSIDKFVTLLAMIYKLQLVMQQ